MKEKKEKFEKITSFSPAFDYLDDPEKKQYGIRAVECRMALKGRKGAISFMFYTGMYLPQTYKRKIPSREIPYIGCDVAYHSPKPVRESDFFIKGKCDLVKGSKCYADGSALKANEWLNILIAEGSGKIWQMMEDEYNEIFNSKNKEK